MTDKSPLCFPLGRLSQFLRSEIIVEYTFNDSRVLIREAIPEGFICPSAPSRVPLIEEMR